MIDYADADRPTDESPDTTTTAPGAVLVYVGVRPFKQDDAGCTVKPGDEIGDDHELHPIRDSLKQRADFEEK